MKYTLLMAGVTALAFSVPAFAQTSVSPRPGLPGSEAAIVLAQALPPAPPPAIVTTPAPGTTVVIAPNAPPPPEAETPPPPPSPSYVWEPGHWTWNGAQFSWDGGKYIEKPQTSASYAPGIGSKTRTDGRGSPVNGIIRASAAARRRGCSRATVRQRLRSGRRRASARHPLPASDDLAEAQGARNSLLDELYARQQYRHPTNANRDGGCDGDRSHCFSSSSWCPFTRPAGCAPLPAPCAAGTDRL